LATQGKRLAGIYEMDFTNRVKAGPSLKRKHGITRETGPGSSALGKADGTGLRGLTKRGRRDHFEKLTRKGIKSYRYYKKAHIERRNQKREFRSGKTVRFTIYKRPQSCWGKCDDEG